MRKLLVLIVLAFVVPAMADVTMTVTDNGTDDGWFTISYVADGGGERPRAFGIDITADNDANICDVNTSGCQLFDIYMGTFNGEAGTGSPVAPSDDPGAAGAMGTSAVTIEMGSLYVGGPNAPAYSGNLIKVRVNKSCNITLSGNSARAGSGCILEDASEATMNYTAATSKAIAVTYGGPDVAEWHVVSKPASWGTARQCHGDADGAQEEFGKGNWVWVGFADIDLLLDGYSLPDTDPNFSTWIAADFDHASEEFGKGNYVRVGFADIDVLLKYYSLPDANVPGDCQSCNPVDDSPVE